MKIAVNTRLLIKNKLDGMGVFTFETFKRIAKNHPEHEFIFLFDRAYSDEFVFSKNITPVVVPPQARHPLLYYIWFEFSVPRILKKLNPDVFVSPDGYLSLRTSVKQLHVIHDLNFESDSFGIPFHELKYYKHFFPRFAKKASRIVTVSEFSKKDISSRYGIERENIDVVYNASGKGFKPLTERAQNEVRKNYSKGKPYFLFVGSLLPRKNIASLLRSFDLFKNQSSSDFKLILAGNKKWWDDEMESAYNKMKHKKDVIFAGRIEQNELEKLTASAFASVNVSLFEGFGIPMIEAMSCDVPVIASDVSALPEIAGDAALLVNPKSPESIANAMMKIYSDEAFRKNLIEKGRTRKDFFSWEKSAELLWKSIEKTIG